MRVLCLAFAAILFSAPVHAASAAAAGANARATAGATAGARAGARAAPQETAGIRDAARLRSAAVASGDIDALRKLIGGEYSHVESNGRERTKTEVLQALMRNEYRISGYGLDDMEITVLGSGRAAIVTGRFHAQTQGQRTPRQFRGRYVRIWTLQPDGWRNTLHQSTEIRPAGTTAPDGRPLPLQ